MGNSVNKSLCHVTCISLPYQKCSRPTNAIKM